MSYSILGIHRVLAILVVASILLPVNVLNNSVLAYAPVNPTTPGAVINTRVLVVYAGINESIVDSINLEPSYLFKLTNNSILNVYLEEEILPKRLYENLTRFIDENSKHMSLAMFMKEYLERYHSEWNITTGCYVRADIMEQYLYDTVTRTYSNTSYNYVLFLLYYPQDKCLRTYYIEKYFWEIHSTRNYTGLIAFGGNTPLFFIDFSSIPVTHPDKTQPLYGYGIPVSIDTFHPLWDIGSVEEKARVIRKYILDYLGFLVLRRLFSDRIPWTPEYYVNISIVDYTNGSGYERVMSAFNKTLLEEYLHALTPYAKWRINIVRVPGNSSSLFKKLLDNSSRIVEDGKTWIVLDYLSTVLLISGHYPVVTVREDKTTIPVYIFVAGKPLHFEYNRQLNFTGAAVPHVAIIVSYPGYYYRILEEGMGMVIAHEIGHMLGLTHPFEGYDPATGNESMIWLYDYIASPMSYAPTLAGWNRGIFTYDAKSLCRYHALDLIGLLKGRKEYEDVINSAEKLLSMDKCLGNNGALSILVETYIKPQNRTSTTKTITVTETETVTYERNHTVTISLLETTTKTITATKTTTSVALETETITSTATETILKEETVTTTMVVEKTPSWITYMFGALIVLSIIAIVSAIIVLARRSRE